MGTIVLLDLMGGVALLLWGLHMVRSGILRAFGSDLRRLLSRALGNRVAGFAAGLALTAVLQSSTATGLMIASFTTKGLVGLVPALAAMLGANVGTTLIVQVFSFNIAKFAPLLFIPGLILFRYSDSARTKNCGRAAIGLGLMLLALHILLDTLGPAETAPAARTLLGSVTNDPVMCILVAGVLTWVAHSSVATVLLIMSLAYSHFVTPAGALALVLGANLGSAINPIIEGARHDDAARFRLPVGNFLNRLAGVVLVLPFLAPLAQALNGFQPDMAKMTALFHIGFNIAMAVLFIGVLDPLAWLLRKLFPDRKRTTDAGAPRYLDDSALATPPLALADVARETLHMGDRVESMLRQVMTALLTNDRTLAAAVSRDDNTVDRLDEAIKLYVMRLTGGSLDDRESRRAMEIVSFAINLEHIGDIIDKNLCELVVKKAKRQLQFSDEGESEIRAFHARVLENLRMAFGVFIAGDVTEARKLLAEKTKLREVELAAAERHFERLREGRLESLETTSLHLDVLRDLKRIHSHICSVAYPVLGGAGELPPAAVAESDPITLPPPEAARP